MFLQGSFSQEEALLCRKKRKKCKGGDAAPLFLVNGQIAEILQVWCSTSNGKNTLIILNHAKEHDLGKKSVKVLIFVISAFFALLNTRIIVPDRDYAKFCNVIYTMNMATHRNLLLQSRTNIKILLILQTCWVS